MPKIIDDFKAEVAASGALSNRSDQRRKLNQISEKYLLEMKSKYSLNTVKNYLAVMRKFVAAESEAGEKHPAMTVLKLDSQEYFQMNEAYRAKVTSRSKAPFKDVDVKKYIEVCESLIEGYNVNHISVVRLALGLAGLTGRRLFSEVMSFGKIGLIENNDNHVIFAGQAKVKEGVKPVFEIPVLSDSDFMVDAWGLLRREKPAIPDNLEKYNFPSGDLELMTRKVDEISFDRFQELYLDSRESLREISAWVEHSNHTGAAKIAKDVFSEFGLKRPHDLRAIYSECCFKVFQPGGDRNSYFSEILGHRENDLLTAQSYKGFRNERGQV